jgi:hypothetical protein
MWCGGGVEKRADDERVRREGQCGRRWGGVENHYRAIAGQLQSESRAIAERK